MESKIMQTTRWTVMNALLCGALGLAALGTSAPASAQPNPTGTVLHCYVSPNDQPMPPGNLGRCTSFYPSPQGYVAEFEIRNLPAGSYSFVWTSDLGVVLPCSTAYCSQRYRGDMAVFDFVTVTYTNLATGEVKSLSRGVRIGGPL